MIDEILRHLQTHGTCDRVELAIPKVHLRGIHGVDRDIVNAPLAELVFGDCDHVGRQVHAHDLALEVGLGHGDGTAGRAGAHVQDAWCSVRDPGGQGLPGVLAAALAEARLKIAELVGEVLET